MNEIYSMQTYNITITAGTGGQIQVFKNGADLGYFRGTKIITANAGDAISVWCDADTGYVFTNLCTPDGTCTTARPFNFTANMNISMTATFTSTTQPCSQQDYTISLDKSSIVVGKSVVAKVKMSGYPGRTWKVIHTNAPSGEIVLGEGILDSYSCGTITLPFNAVGSYILKGRVCDVWMPSGAGAHCSLYDTDTNNVVTLAVTAIPPPTSSGCDPTTCPSTRNFCVLGNCVPKNYVFIGAAAIIGFMLLSRGD